ncbi:hypothetical protein [Aeromicrobium sp. NPDC092404]|uniref:hypothetical protein n=1 Tax=Aeromicrobium sp. NPDC092404 TaxID=3154976 RepID=UPI00342EDA9C
MRHTIRVALVAATASAALIGSAATATAESAAVDDKRYDVLYTSDPEEGRLKLASQGTYQEAITGGSIDAKSLKANHGKEFLSIRVDLHRLGSDYGTVGGSIKLNGGVDEDANFTAGVEGDEAWAEVYPSETSNSDTYCASWSSTGRVKASGKAGVGGYVQLYIPRSCLGNPNQVRVGAASFMYPFLVDAARKGATVRQQAQASREALVEDGPNFYVDPISAKYYGAGSRDAAQVIQLTPWLSRN